MNFWKSQDVFGERVEFTFKGKRSYQTSVGAFVSVLLKIIIVCFITYEFYVIFTRKHPAMYTSTKIVEDAEMNPFDLGFEVALGFSTRNKQLINNRTSDAGDQFTPVINA